ncbi:hypothetical protein KA111_01765 [Candidatus Woesebacteria bacterium]|nr:hypothetical protein [Candidatus Woesebacteria bacterium]
MFSFKSLKMVLRNSLAFLHKNWLQILISVCALLVLASAIYSWYYPINWELTKINTAQIKVYEVTKEKVMFTYLFIGFYIEGDSPSIGHQGDKSYVHNNGGTYCVISKDTSTMDEHSEEGSSCILSSYDNFDTLIWKHMSGQASMSVGPIWTSR